MNLIKFALVLTLTFGLTDPVKALPGQDFDTVRSWVNQHPILSKSKLKPAIADLPGLYLSKINLGSRLVTFRVWIHPSNRQVFEESIQDQGLVFSQDSPNGIKLIQQIYGQNITRDFQNAQIISISASNFYKGKKFAYTADSNMFVVFPIADLSHRINRAIYCQKHPDICAQGDV